MKSEVTTTTTTAFPWHYGLAMLGTGSCPDGVGVSAVPLSQCQEAALKVVLPPGARNRKEEKADESGEHIKFYKIYKGSSVFQVFCFGPCFARCEARPHSTSSRLWCGRQGCLAALVTWQPWQPWHLDFCWNGKDNDRPNKINSRKPDVFFLLYDFFLIKDVSVDSRVKYRPSGWVLRLDVQCTAGRIGLLSSTWAKALWTRKCWNLLKSLNSKPTWKPEDFIRFTSRHLSLPWTFRCE